MSRQVVISIGAMVISFSDAAQVREHLQLGNSQKLVFTNGCFDVLHAGHVRYLAEARQLGDALVVGLNGDDSVHALKGAGRPVNGEDDRAEVLAALRAVDAVVIFPEVRATALIQRLQPDIYVKGADYTVATLHAEERAVLEEVACRIAFVPLVPGRSTTSTLARLRESAPS